MKPAVYAVIDRTALQSNLAVVRQQAPTACIMAVIKANAYGHGLLRIARLLAGQVNSLAVARTQEALILREHGIDAPITVLQGFVGAAELKLYQDCQLEAVVHQQAQLECLLQGKTNAPIGVWLKLDTGMGRLGFLPDEWEAAHRILQTCPCVRQPLGLMTHLASADSHSSKQTVQQLACFHQLTNGLPGQQSIANSAAILSGIETQADWVRAGLMLYGVSPFSEQTAAALGLKPVMTLMSRLIAIKTLAPGETVGYGADWRCERQTRVGIVSAGYGDGYPRQVKNASVLIRQQRVPLIGRVSMDMLAVDLSALPEADINDEVTLWGKGLPVEEVAKAAGTIPYTLLCGVMARVDMIEQ